MLILSISLIILGIIGIICGIRTYKKPFYVGYLAFSPYNSGCAYIAVPSGLTMILWGTGMLPFVSYWGAVILFISSIPVGLAGLWISFTYFDPPWVRRLKVQGELYNALRTEALRVGHSTLNKRIQSQADLEVWVGEVRQKYGL